MKRMYGAFLRHHFNISKASNRANHVHHFQHYHHYRHRSLRIANQNRIPHFMCPSKIKMMIGDFVIAQNKRRQLQTHSNRLQTNGKAIWAHVKSQTNK